MLAKLLSGPFAIVYLGGGLWGLALSLGYLAHHIGWVFSLLSLFLLPAVLYLVPWYAGLVDGYWTPFLVTYGTTAIVFVLGAVMSTSQSNA